MFFNSNKYIVSVIGNYVKLYAVDSKILAIVDTIVERKILQKDLESISVWMLDWKLYTQLISMKRTQVYP